MRSLMSLVQSSDILKSTVTPVTLATRPESQDFSCNRCSIDPVTSVTNPNFVTSVTNGESVRLQEKTNNYQHVTGVTSVTGQFHMPESFPESLNQAGTKLENLPGESLLGLRQLRDLLIENGLNISRTPGGNIFAWGEPLLNLDALEFVELLARDISQDLEAIRENIPVMDSGNAQALLERLEDAYAGEGFHVRPGWEGLFIPEDWPPVVGLSLQSLYLAASYAQTR